MKACRRDLTGGFTVIMGDIFGKKLCALIDMDGVLYDSMPGHTLAWKRMMEELGVECTRDEFYLYEGMTGAATINLLFRRAFGRDCEPERVKELYAIKSRYFKALGERKPMPGADRMLSALRRGGLRRVLVTGSGQASLLESLDRDYPGMFAPGHRVTAHDVTHGKPDPEPYLKGASKAGLSPADCIVIENAPLGVRAGKAAGCFTIAVTTGPIPREEFEREGADMIFPSMPAFADFLERELALYQGETAVGKDADKDKNEHGKVVYVESADTALANVLDSLDSDRVFLLTDSNVAPVCRLDMGRFSSVHVIEPGERSKCVEGACGVWGWLTGAGATRKSVLVNCGGGVVTDLGGFAAATFKRGIRFVNIPTSVLGAVDAAIGGKTGIDFMGYKNEVGAFVPAERVVVSAEYLDTLPQTEVISGLGEVVKMAMITDETMYRRILEGNVLTDRSLLAAAMRHAALAKEDIVEQDPRERGLRRILNFGHTAGHAFEMLAASLGTPVSHGGAVAHGILTALRMSARMLGLPREVAGEYAERILRRYFSPLPFEVAARRDELLRLMAHDKKNTHEGEVTFVLLESIGNPVVRACKTDEVQF